MWGWHVWLINYLSDWHVNKWYFLIIIKLMLHLFKCYSINIKGIRNRELQRNWVRTFLTNGDRSYNEPCITKKKKKEPCIMNMVS